MGTCKNPSVAGCNLLRPTPRDVSVTSTPATRHSLILRLRNRDDADAWHDFVNIYEPVIYRVAIQRQMQHADAMELVQRVLLAVARAIERFQPDSGRAKFRTWLHRITHNEFCREYHAARKHTASGDSAVQMMLNELPARLCATEDRASDDFTVEYRRAIFRWAAERVRQQVKPTTWQAFWRTSVDNISVEDVARETGLSVGAVYVARSRVMARLQKQATLYEEPTS